MRMEWVATLKQTHKHMDGTKRIISPASRSITSRCRPSPNNSNTCFKKKTQKQTSFLVEPNVRFHVLRSQSVGN